MLRLTKIELSGYKSIERMSLDLGSLNVLIGPNGAGKSNFVSFFKLLYEMVAGRLQVYIATSGGADALLFYGPRTTQVIEATLIFDAQHAIDKYHMRLRHAAPETLAFDEERIEHGHPGGGKHDILGAHRRETGLNKAVEEGKKGTEIVCLALGGCHTFQFHDTSATSPMRQSVYIHDNRYLRHDAMNLAAILYKLQQVQPTAYHRIVETVRQIAPWFGDFVLRPLELNKENVRLEWKERHSDILFGPHQLSDGSLRAIALITLLLQPEDDLPSLVIIDEPELGLHPYATVVLAGLLEKAACHCQVVIATQSVSLLDQFDAENVIVVDRDERKSTFKRLEERNLKEWLEEYTLGELWEKNVIGGGPA